MLNYARLLGVQVSTVTFVYPESYTNFRLIGLCMQYIYTRED